VSLERFARVLSWHNGSVEVEAGITIKALTHALKQRGQQLPMASTFDDETVVGAASVGTKVASLFLLFSYVRTCLCWVM